MYLVKVEAAKCTGDGECVDTCPSSLFTMETVDGKQIAVFADPNEDCLGCEACIAACPSEALTMTES